MLTNATITKLEALACSGYVALLVRCHGGTPEARCCPRWRAAVRHDRMVIGGWFLEADSSDGRSSALIAETRSVFRFVWDHPANRGRRLRQLARASGFQLGARLLGRRTQTPVGDRGARIWVDLHRTAATKALYANPPDWPHMLVWEQRLKGGDLFLDVGANVGTYSVFCAALGAQVIAFEPAPDTAALLRENVALNGMSIEVIEAAVGAEHGKAGFTSGQDAVNQIDPAGTVKVNIVTLDSVIGDRRVAGLKIDVEGFELDVLKGLAWALEERRVDLMQLEWNGCADRAALAAALSDYGYRLWEANRDGCLLEAKLSAFGGDLFAAPA